MADETAKQGAGVPAEAPPPTALAWAGFIAMLTGTFLAVLDIQIVAGSTGELQAGLSASRDEIATVQTAYLIAEVIGIALAGFLGRALGTRLLFTLAALMFCLCSGLCAMAWDLNSLVVFRALQGFFGASMIPTTVATIFLIFPQRLQMVGNAAMGFSINAATAFGPVIGGFITNTFGWRGLFWLNLFPGLAAALLVWIGLRTLPPPQFALLRKIDVWGLLFLTLFLGLGEYILEEGPKHDWFASSQLTLLALVSGLSAILFLWRALTAETPIVDLRPFGNIAFAMPAAVMLVIGGTLFGSVFLTPLFLASVRGFNSLQIGDAMALLGLSMMATSFFMGVIGRHITDTRPWGFLGIGLTALSCVLQSHLTSQAGPTELALPLILRGMGLTLVFNSVLPPALQSLPREQVHSGASLISTMRNVGGAVGIATLSTVHAHAFAFHRQEIYTAVDPANSRVAMLLAGMEARLAELGASDPARQAMMYYAGMLDREALVMAFNDQFVLLSVLLVISSSVVFFLRPMRRAPPAPRAEPSPASA
jgi:DHA2 family multidrug resistance protein